MHPTRSVYLHGVIQELVWVEQLEGYKVPGKEHLALKLKKALYGTKQGGNQWRKTLEHFMQEILEWTCSEPFCFSGMQPCLWTQFCIWLSGTNTREYK